MSNQNAEAQRLAELRRAKGKALSLLLAAAGLFLLTLVLPPNVWVLGLRACTEAALIGGLADWFAVSALFRRIPTGVRYFTRHTNVLSRNKDRIAVNLAAFIEEKFLDADSLVNLIRKTDPAAQAAGWLAKPENEVRLAGHVVATMDAAMRLIDEEHVRQVIRDAARAGVDKVDMSGTAAVVLRALTEHGRHQDLLEQVLDQLLAAIRSEPARDMIAKSIVQWIRTGAPLKKRVLPAEWLGENGAALVARAVGLFLEQVQTNRAHDLRVGFDEAVAGFVQRLETDPAARAKGEQIKHYILEDRAFGAYLDGLWDSLRAWILEDLHDANSRLREKIREACGWLGQRLSADPELRAELNDHLEQAAREAAPEFSRFLAAHIRDTIRRWDAAEMAREVELSIGKDLQTIRISGTFVGGAIGLLLYLIPLLVSGLPSWLR